MHKGDIVQLDENVFYSHKNLFLNNKFYRIVEEPREHRDIILTPINPAIMQRLKKEYSAINDFGVSKNCLKLVQRRGEVVG